MAEDAVSVISGVSTGSGGTASGMGRRKSRTAIKARYAVAEPNRFAYIFSCMSVRRSSIRAPPTRVGLSVAMAQIAQKWEELAAGMRSPSLSVHFVSLCCCACLAASTSGDGV